MILKNFKYNDWSIEDNHFDFKNKGKKVKTFTTAQIVRKDELKDLNNVKSWFKEKEPLEYNNAILSIHDVDKDHVLFDVFYHVDTETKKDVIKSLRSIEKEFFI